uniref:Uncharacterized protein n=1 Tax=Anguilla anguilla TaxID=7936 RepID=A0A0E9PW58_ANGAN
MSNANAEAVTTHTDKTTRSRSATVDTGVILSR